MAYLVLIAFGVVFACILAVLATRTVLSISFRNTCLKVSLTVVNCGVRYESRGQRLSLLCGRWVPLTRSLTTKPKKKKEEKPGRAEKEKPKAKPRRKLPVSVIIQIVKAGILFVARFLSYVQYDEGKLQFRPVVANPALAGMAYGWSQALKGAFPGLRQVFDFAPTYCTGSGVISGRAEFSIKNRQIAVLMWRLWGDLPIKELIKSRFSRKR